MIVVLAMFSVLLGSCSGGLVQFDDPILPILNAPASLFLTNAFGDCTLVKSILPITPDTSIMNIIFHSASSNVEYKIGTAANQLLANLNFDRTKDLTVAIHGWLGSAKDSLNIKLANNLLSLGTVNVISLDTKNLIDINYVRSNSNVPGIGKALGDFLLALKSGGYTKKIHMIGHSLGAHIAGFAAKRMKSQGSTCDRISGLDPAGPCYHKLPASDRLDVTDCTFVDVIHTDAGILGYSKSMGHMDFWPNNGANQPYGYVPIVSHTRALNYFIESVVKPKNFPATKCLNYFQFQLSRCPTPLVTVDMGYGCVSGTKGDYFLRTSADSPYGFGDSSNFSFSEFLTKIFTFPNIPNLFG